jgi:toxin-antitoxin system PIN domain toxin
LTTALLDLNVLVALLWPAHEHHQAAHRWFGGRGGAPWATCALTQLGFVRVVSNPAFSRDALSPSAAIALLAENLKHPAHEFWFDRLQVPGAVRRFEGALTGHRQFTDAYLLALAAKRRAMLATFDRGVRALGGAQSGSALEIIATR